MATPTEDFLTVVFGAGMFLVGLAALFVSIWMRRDSKRSAIAAEKQVVEAQKANEREAFRFEAEQEANKREAERFRTDQINQFNDWWNEIFSRTLHRAKSFGDMWKADLEETIKPKLDWAVQETIITVETRDRMINQVSTNCSLAQLPVAQVLEDEKAGVISTKIDIKGPGLMTAHPGKMVVWLPLSGEPPKEYDLPDNEK